MAELSKIFKSNDLYEAWRDNKDIPSNVLAVVLDETGNDVEKVAFGTNDITGEYKTYEVTKGEPKEYTSNNNVYVSNGTYDFSYNSTCYLLKANIRQEFDWPQRENDIYTEPFVFTLYGINGEVDINNIRLYWGEIFGTASNWGKIDENKRPINYVKNSDGSYTCTVWFDNIYTSNNNFFIAYRLPSSIGSETIDVTPYIIGYWSD